MMVRRITFASPLRRKSQMRVPVSRKHVQPIVSNEISSCVWHPGLRTALVHAVNFCAARGDHG
jgi:hypothetical protein